MRRRQGFRNERPGWGPWGGGSGPRAGLAVLRAPQAAEGPRPYTPQLSWPGPCTPRAALSLGAWGCHQPVPRDSGPGRIPVRSPATGRGTVMRGAKPRPSPVLPRGGEADGGTR